MISPKLEPALRAHRERLRNLYAKDREANLPGVELPEALERKWPKAGEKFIWSWFWPSRNLMRDQRNGIIRLHHVLDVTFQKAIREAVERAGFDKRVTPHTLRQKSICILQRIPASAYAARLRRYEHESSVS